MNKAWEDLAQQEAAALAELLAKRGEHCVMVIIIGASTDSDGPTLMLHSVAGNTTGWHLRQFICGAERKLKWLHDKLHRRV